MTSQPGGPASFTAKGHASVAAQIGHMSGGTVHQRNNYIVNPNDPPEVKYQVARNFLMGGVSPRAERMLAELALNDNTLVQLAATGHSSSEVGYYWALALIGGRSFDQLDPDQDMGKLTRIAEMANPHDPIEWRTANELVIGLIQSMVDNADEFNKGRDQLPLDRRDEIDEHRKRLRQTIGHLPPQRMEEINRFYQMILDGATQDMLDASDAAKAATQRMSNYRTHRAWKFFEPAPVPPRLRVARLPGIGAFEWLSVLGGGAVFALGVVLAIMMLLTASGPTTVIVLVLCGAGGAAVGSFGLQREWLLSRRGTKERELRGRRIGSVAGPDQKPRRAARHKFAAAIEYLVDVQFTQHYPKTPGAWATDTEGIRTTLKDEIIELYGNPEVDPFAINWLIRWHAIETARKWSTGALYEFRDRLRVPGPTTMGFVTGVIGLTIGALIAIVTMIGAHFFAALGVAALLGVGGFFATIAAVDIYVEKRRYPADRADYEQRFQEQQRAFTWWQAQLADRPTDEEMARWLDYDKSHLKTEAMRQYGLASRDLSAPHVVLTEAAPWCMRAREEHGPPRYSAYIVLVFLLTDNGVREVEVDLDFLTGAIHNERRHTFRYGAIASARVTEVGVRFDGTRRHVVGPEDRDRIHVDPNALILRRAFRLTLVNRESINVLIEHFDEGFFDQVREHPEFLLNLALDASGIPGALWILEGVAAEGKEWILRERERRSRRLMDYKQRHHAPPPPLEPSTEPLRGVEDHPHRKQLPPSSQ